MRQPFLLLLVIVISLSGCMNQPTMHKDGGLVIKLKIDKKEKMDETIAILTGRLNGFGIPYESIQRKGRDVIEIAIPGEHDQQKMTRILTASARLEFWETYEASEVYQYLEGLNKKLAELNALDTLKLMTAEDAEPDTLAAEEKPMMDLIDESKPPVHEDFSDQFPLFTYLRPAIIQNNSIYQFQKGPVAGYAELKDTAAVMEILRANTSSFPRDLGFCWTTLPYNKEDGKEWYILIVLKNHRHEGAAIKGDVIVDASARVNEYNGGAEVSVAMNELGAKAWADITQKNIGRSIAMVFDGRVYSYPTVQSKIEGGVSSISGNFTMDEAKEMASLLKSGAYPTNVKVLSIEVIPSAGK